jgi:hypothetical protein
MLGSVQLARWPLRISPLPCVGAWRYHARSAAIDRPTTAGGDHNRHRSRLCHMHLCHSGRRPDRMERRHDLRPGAAEQPWRPDVAARGQPLAGDGGPCKSAPVTGRRRCRMHGGADGSGAPTGARNGNFRHGRYTKEVAATRRGLREATLLLRIIR